MAYFSRQSWIAGIAFGGVITFAAVRAAAQKASEPHLTMLVYDYSGMASSTLLDAENQASRIFSRSGVAIAWRLCRTSDLLHRECPQPSPSTPALRLVGRFHTAANGVRAQNMGYTTGDFATVSVDFVEELAKQGIGQMPEMLGHVIAHEIGHLLLGRGHAVSGIMRARWTLKDWALVRQRSFNFTPEQARLLKIEVSNRTSSFDSDIEPDSKRFD